jgi:IMP dehydrogenase
MEIHGLICLKDIFSYEQLKLANKDPNGKLYVGAAVGANKDYIERAERLVEAGCNVLVVDVANGHSQLAIDATETLKDKFSQVDIVAGSIATGEGAERLIRSGADGIRCGIGNGSICITRIVAGSGVPQLTALLDTSPVCQIYEIPLCSDGGNRYSGNMCKALASGANCVMLGRLVAGCDESPGKSFLKEGKFVKMFRGMAGRT